jgi:DNA processing protein
MVGREAWFALGLVRGLTPANAFALAEHFGGPERVVAASAAALDACGVAPAVAARLRDAPARAAEEQRRLDALGARTVTWGDAGYPAPLRTIAEPPLALAVRGTLVEGDHPAVAIVGARRCSDYGRRIAHELATGLAQAGLTVVSGLAAGVDGAAHRGALEAGGRTVAVMATGMDAVYPSWHDALARAVAVQGALVTEFPLGSPPRQHHFPRRNRIVAGLSAGVVVVEAAEQSGSLITARLALEQGREVFAVPGPIGTARHRGSHRLIRQGATLVTSVDDVLAEIAPALLARVAAARLRAAAATLTTDERAVLDAMDDGPAHVDEITARTGRAAAADLETLLALELRGLVEQRPGARFARRRAA